MNDCDKDSYRQPLLSNDGLEGMINGTSQTQLTHANSRGSEGQIRCADVQIPLRVVCDMTRDSENLMNVRKGLVRNTAELQAVEVPS